MKFVSRGLLNQSLTYGSRQSLKFRGHRHPPLSQTTSLRFNFLFWQSGAATFMCLLYQGQEIRAFSAVSLYVCLLEGRLLCQGVEKVRVNDTKPPNGVNHIMYCPVQIISASKTKYS